MGIVGKTPPPTFFLVRHLPHARAFNRDQAASARYISGSHNVPRTLPLVSAVIRVMYSSQRRDTKD